VPRTGLVTAVAGGAPAEASRQTDLAAETTYKRC